MQGSRYTVGRYTLDGRNERNNSNFGCIVGYKNNIDLFSVFVNKFGKL